MAPASSPVLLVSYDDFERASRAHEALRALGLPPQALELRVLHDEAGPVEGNFVAGNGRRDRRSMNGVMAEIPGGDITPYDLNFAQQVERGANLLVIRPRDDAERTRIVARLRELDPPPG